MKRARWVPRSTTVICCGPTEVEVSSFSFVTGRTWFSIGPLSNPLSLRTTNSFVAGLYFSKDWHYSLTALSKLNFICRSLESLCKSKRSRSSHLTQTISVNGCALSTQQSTCLACSSDHISSDGNVFISLNNLSLLMNLYEITPPLVKHCVCSEEVIDRSSALRVSDTYGRLKALMLAVLTVSISGFLGWVYWFVWHNCKENQEEIFLI